MEERVVLENQCPRIAGCYDTRIGSGMGQAAGDFVKG
jgi:hypothetical protein